MRRRWADAAGDPSDAVGARLSAGDADAPLHPASTADRIRPTSTGTRRAVRPGWPSTGDRPRLRTRITAAA